MRFRIKVTEYKNTWRCNITNLHIEEYGYIPISDSIFYYLMTALLLKIKILVMVGIDKTTLVKDKTLLRESSEII